MWPFLKALVLDEGRFLGTIRALVVIVGGVLTQTPALVTDFGLPAWIGPVVIGAGVFLRSGASAQARARKNGEGEK